MNSMDSQAMLNNSCTGQAIGKVEVRSQDALSSSCVCVLGRANRFEESANEFEERANKFEHHVRSRLR